MFFTIKTLGLGDAIGLLPLVDASQVRGFVDSGVVDRTILHWAEQKGYGLIVMGTHGRTGLSHAFLGSIAERVIRRASCPVMTHRLTEAAPEHGTATTGQERPVSSRGG